MRAFVVVGMGYGDEGKGSVVDWLTRDQRATLVIRFNGGAQAAHHVVTPNHEHTFRMFGSGTLAGADTYLSRHVLVNPMAIALEAAELQDKGVVRPFERISIHPGAPITTPFHVALNRLREMSRGHNRHGSCGLGIGETMHDLSNGEALRWGHLSISKDWPNVLRNIAKAKYAQAQTFKRPPLEAYLDAIWDQEMDILMGRDFDAIIETYKILGEDILATEYYSSLHKTIIFEGAQGVLIDETYGEAPYHTWSTCTPKNALEVWGDRGPVEILGVIRAYMTRHGPGPFPTETDLRFVNSDLTNGVNDWQGALRYGWPDPKAIEYSAHCCRTDGGLDGLIVTCLDQIKDEWGIHVPGYLPNLWSKIAVPGFLAEMARVPLWGLSRGDQATDKERIRVPKYIPEYA